MLLKQDFEWMARYNQWMNARLYGLAAQLDPNELRADKGAFFGSILSTLHHLHASDAHWMRRFAEHATALVSLNGLRERTLPELVRRITYPDFQVLRVERESLDRTIVAFADEATEALYGETLRYTNSAGDGHAQCFALVLRHFFNHQTHHRGQVTTLFSQLGVDVGVTDLSGLPCESAGPGQRA